MDLLWVFSVLCLLCICMRLFICALWSPARGGGDLLEKPTCVISIVDIIK